MTDATHPRWKIVLLLMMIATLFGSNHIAARITFDSGTSILTAVALRSTCTALALLLVIRLYAVSLVLPRAVARKGILVGLLLAVQSFCLYSAVARIPVGLALLTFNIFPFLLALMTWALAGKRPTNRTLLVMPVALFGLCLALNLFGAGQSFDFAGMVPGLFFAIGAAVSFAAVLFLSERWLGDIDGRIRSLLMMATIAVIAGSLGFAIDGFALPQNRGGWIALAVLLVFYGVAFSSLFVLLPRFGILNNASVMNFEPVAALLLGVLILDQTMAPLQVAGVLIVLGAMFGLAGGEKSQQ